MLSDIQIAQSVQAQPIQKVAAKLGLQPEDLYCYGHDKAKVDPKPILAKNTQQGHLILVTAMSPTPAGEGKTTTSIGLADSLQALGQKTVLALREPSLGPVFGIKGGAAGGGWAQVVPMEDINLHFTGDFHAIAAANNLLAAMIDNHIQQGNQLQIDPRRITWKRAVDMNDRQLRQIVSGLGGRSNGHTREDGFDITVASEVMAVLCLAHDLADLKERLGRIVVARRYDDSPVTAHDLKAAGAMAALLKDAIKPNLVQTLEACPAFVHGGPFANIAHGCNSVLATRLALALGDYCVTEAGFGADLGGEKFLDIVCPAEKLEPSAVVLVATLRALRYHGGLDKAHWGEPNLAAVQQGLANLARHVSNLRDLFKQKVVLALNQFPNDSAEEIACLADFAQQEGIAFACSRVHAEGSKGGQDLAQAVIDLCQKPERPQLAHPYEADWPLVDKIRALVQKVYHGADVELSPKAKRLLQQFTDEGYQKLPICMAKTQYSFSDDAKKLAAPEGFHITVRDVQLKAGAGFIVALTGEIMTMPGLPKVPAAEQIDVSDDGQITGLF